MSDMLILSGLELWTHGGDELAFSESYNIRTCFGNSDSLIVKQICFCTLAQDKPKTGEADGEEVESNHARANSPRVSRNLYPFGT